MLLEQSWGFNTMPPTKVYLIGENHFDLRKSERYARVFDRFRPDVITVEMTEDYIKTNEERLSIEFSSLRRIESIRGLFLLSYDAAQRYKQAHPCVEVKPIDYAREKRVQELAEIDKGSAETLLDLSFWREFISSSDLSLMILTAALGPENIGALAGNGHSINETLFASLIANLQKDDETFQFMSSMLDCLYLVKREDDYSKSIERDSIMIDEIMKQSGVVVHTGGIGHIYGSDGNMYERMKTQGVDVERYLLIDFCEDLPSLAAFYRSRLEETLLKELKDVQAAKLMGVTCTQ